MAEQNTQAVVLQQPNGEKLQLELKITQVADDTTAMKSFEKGADISIASFDYATGIAVFLALCATGLAYWFGVRSFVLTKQSFDSLIEQIKSSENVTLETNQHLINSQYNQLITNHKIEELKKSKKDLKQLFVDFITVAESLSTDIGFKAMESKNIDFSNLAKKGTYPYVAFKEIQSNLKIMQTLRIKISFDVFYLVDNKQDEINKISSSILIKGGELSNKFLNKESTLMQEIKVYRKEVELFRYIAKQILEEITLDILKK